MCAGFVAKNHTVIGCGRSAEHIAALQTEYGSPHRFDVVDVTSESNVRDWATSALASHGAPDLLLNNAALINQNAKLWDVPADEFSRLVDVNIKGVANVIRHFVPAMISRGTGVIVNFSSAWGRSTSPEVAPYCATKWAIEGLTRAMAQELPAGMAAVPVNPGIINTDMLQTCFADGANNFPSAEEWCRQAVPFFLALSAKDNGESLSVS